MSPLAILLTIIGLSFLVTCLLLWLRLNTDDKKALREAEKQRVAARARWEAERSTRGDRLQKLAGGRTSRIVPLNRRAGK